MSCDQQILSPDSSQVDSLQVLGTGGDLNFDESGTVALTNGQTEVNVAFTFEKESALYAFDYLYVTSPGTTPDSFTCVPNNFTKTGFRVELGGAPTGSSDVLYWHVLIPDSLRSCPNTPNPPAYAIVRPAQQGITPLVINQPFIDVVFDSFQADNNWLFLACEIENNTSGNPQVFSWVCTTHTIAGFSLEFQGAPSEEGYSLRWRIA